MWSEKKTTKERIFRGKKGDMGGGEKGGEKTE